MAKTDAKTDSADTSKTRIQQQADENKKVKFCPCGKQAVDFGDGLKCPQHFTTGDDLVESTPVDGDATEFEADEGTNKGATELAVDKIEMSDAGKELAKDPTQDAKAMTDVEKSVGNSQEATDKAGTTDKEADKNAKAGGAKSAADADAKAAAGEPTSAAAKAK